MSKRIILFLTFAIAVALGGLNSLVAQNGNTGAFAGIESSSDDVPPPPPPPGARGGRRHDPFDGLDLTQQQKDQIGAIRSAERAASDDNIKKARDLDTQLRAMIDAGNFTLDTASTLIKSKSDAMAAVELNRLSAEAETRKVLTAAQQAKLVQMRAQRPAGPPDGGFGRPPER